MKKNNHITINLNDDDYNLITKLANYYNRSLADIARLILMDHASKLFIEYQKVLYPENNNALKIPSNIFNY